MQFEVTRGSLSGALGVVGTGIALVAPDAKYLGWAFIALGLFVFFADVRIKDGQVKIGSDARVGPGGIRMLWPLILPTALIVASVFGLVIGIVLLAQIPLITRISTGPVTHQPGSSIVDLSVYSRKQCFDYSTNDGLTRVTRSAASYFDLRFSKRSNTSIYLYKDNSSTVAIARIKNTPAGQPVDFADFDSSSRVYPMNIGEQFIIKNAQGEFLQGKILSLKDDSRGDPNDEVCFAYEFDSSKAGRFTSL
jgi:hypothetical protein